MSADLLREAAALMRDRASSAINSGDGEPWYPAEELHDLIGGGSRNTADATYIASWHPAVALAVADWLDDQLAAFLEVRPGNHLSTQRALAVARAYLGMDA